MTNTAVPTPVKIQLAFRIYRKEMRDIWESYNLINFYMSEIHTLVKSGDIRLLTLPSLITSDKRTYSSQDTFGAIDHMRSKANPRRSLVDAVATFEDFPFEDFLAHLVYLTYRDY